MHYSANSKISSFQRYAAGGVYSYIMNARPPMLHETPYFLHMNYSFDGRRSVCFIAVEQQYIPK
jgi:hypothetical protein